MSKTNWVNDIPVTFLWNMIRQYRIKKNNLILEKEKVIHTIQHEKCLNQINADLEHVSKSLKFLEEAMIARENDLFFTTQYCDNSLN